MTDDRPPASGAWADLIALRGGEHILFVGSDRSGGAIDRLRSRGATVSVVDADAILAGEILPGEKPDLAISAHLGPDEAARLLGRLPPEVRFAVIADNRRSPLASKRDRRDGWTSRQLSAIDGDVLALLRSADVCTTAFRVDLPDLATTVLDGAAVGAGGGRRLAIRALAALARRGLATPVVPAWLVVRTDKLDAPTGRMGVAENDQGAVLYGHGPDSVEKVYANDAEVAAVVTAMTLLNTAGIEVGGQIIDQPSARRLRLEWVQGTVLDANAMKAEELARWTESAAELLGQIHASTRDETGMVLVHGDFWLGAVVVQGDAISGIIDWTDSFRGSPSVDLATLAAVAKTRTDISAEETTAVLAALDRGYKRGSGKAVSQ